MPQPNLTILHGYAETPQKVWIPWLHAQAEEAGLPVWAPSLPDPLRPSYRRWLKATMKGATRWNADTVIVGHSLGGVIALRALEQMPKVKIAGLVLVGSPFAAIISAKQLVDFYAQNINWDELRRRVGRIIIVHAQNDPLVPYDHGWRYAEALDGDLHLYADGHHFIGKQAPEVLDALNELLRPKRKK